MIKEICSELDKSIEQRVVDNNFIELIYKVIDNFDIHPKKFTDMILEIHNEVDSFRASYIMNHLDYDIKLKEPIPIPEWLIEELQKIKQKYIEFWNKN